ncbi:MAG: flagellar motor protein MotA, partial [Acidobacteriota bacterium]|nr:flagellar motor protein MotA [Acidobacteriota bacterium]
MPGRFAALLLQTRYWDLISNGTLLSNVVLVILICFSIYSWTVIFAKWSAFSAARKNDTRFLRAFRKAGGLEAVMVASEQFRPS